MRIVRYSQYYNSVDSIVLAIGKFDGVHLGHQAVINNAKLEAEALKLPLSIMCFEPNPLVFFRPGLNYKRIDSIRTRIFKFAHMGIDLMFLQNFNHQFAGMTAKEFIEKILIEKLKVKSLVIGYDFEFGNKRSGNIELLEEYAKQGYFNLKIILKQVNEKSEIYSSSLVKAYLEEGKVDKIRSILGAYYTIHGKVRKGKRLARNLGYRTANIAGMEQLVLRYGVYEVKSTFNGQVLKGVANFGVKPTLFNNTKPLLEVHFINFSGDLYNQNLTIEFLRFIREEKKFESVNALKQQIMQDIMGIENNNEI
ncbi:riboflavin biosynthesis protein RibF [Rickettsiales endosymbiont of Stachyamoeba lipophora]|uniref:riboflavin biosynthesis protein RibF n=1 Tax=Rickettsiales endosymbiont of Stachyamoeba lipophora TaxID=2486578 RepID=UPI000F652979|nr:riboflavin biosynthesis protein RibF [Rickettsiales endosymbiont of Stachyamoeba lipophora]AZL16017.1 riboflavin biosynthesis protein RibF [Rickettsiales endosymbiont of Stachyamoeba lipophora]